MAGFKMGAHPLVVAVAMGLLGPGAVLDEGQERSMMKSELSGHLLDTPDEVPTAEDFARVEDQWHEVRELV